MSRRTVPAWALAELARSLPPGAPAINVHRHARRVVVANTALGAAVVTKPLFGVASMRLLPNPRSAIRFPCPACTHKLEFRNLTLPAFVHCGHCGRRFSLDTRGQVGNPGEHVLQPPPAPAPFVPHGKTPAMVAREAYEAVVVPAAGQPVTTEQVRNAVEPRAKALEAAEARLHTEEKRLKAMKTTFVNAAAHELQTPMTPLLLSLHSLESDALAPAAGAGATAPGREVAVQRAIRNAKRLEGVIASLVRVSQMQAGQMAVAATPVDLVAEARRAADAWQAKADAAGIRLAVRWGRPYHVEADPKLLGDALSHLLSNAVRFTPAGGRIDMRVVADGTGAQLIVADTGAGIPSEDLDRIFEPFVQLDAAARQTEGGLGLGLFFARAIAEAHGGTLSVQSAGPGKGSTFTLRLPAHPPERQTA